jgi:hypothetical protein
VRQATIRVLNHSDVPCFTEAGGDDEFQGNVDYTFTRPDGTQLGTQAHCAWLQDCKCAQHPRIDCITHICLDPEGFRDVTIAS